MRKRFYILKNIYVYRKFLISFFAVALLMFSGYSISKGMLVDVSVPNSFTFGEPVEITSKSIFSRVEYTYRQQGETDWSYNTPLRAGDYQVKIKTNRAFGGVSERIIDFKILPKQTTLTLLDDTIAYGEVPRHSVTLYNQDSIDHIEFAYQDPSSNQTLIELTSIVVKDPLGNDVSDSYVFEIANENVTISPQLIKINLLDKVEVYQGKTLLSNDFEITKGQLIEGDELTIITSGSQFEVGLSDNVILNAKVLNQGVDVTANYIIEFEPGILEITPRPLIIETHALEKQYDGIPLSNLSFDILEGSLVEGHKIKIINEPSINTVGTIPNSLEFDVVDIDGTIITANYSIETIEQPLEIKPILLDIKTHDSIKVYDGYPLKNLNYELLEGKLLPEHKLIIDDYPIITTVGEENNRLQFKIIDDQDNDVSNYYDIKVSYGKLEITPRLIKIATESDEKIDDDLPLSNLNYDIIEGSLAEKDTLEIVESTVLTEIGSIENRTIFKVRNDQNEDVTDNYIIEYSYGTLTIVPRIEITIETQSKSKIYDGTSLSNPNYTIKEGDLLEGHTIIIISYSSHIDAGVIKNGIELDIVDIEGNSVNHYYIVEYEHGDLEILKRPITLSTASDEKFHDGIPLYNTGYELIEGSLVAGDSIIVKDYPEITEPGETENLIEFQILNSEKTDVTNNYAIDYQAGRLKVISLTITIETASDQKVYDGTPLHNLNYEIIEGSLYEAHYIHIDDFSALVNAKQIDNVLEFTIFDHDGNDVSNYYSFEFIYGTLEVTPRPITIETASQDKVYDGTPLYNPDYNIIEGSIVAGDAIEVIDYTSITDVNTVENQLALEFINDNHETINDNYLITYQLGKLEITPRLITIQTMSEQKTYDGTPLYNKDFELIEGKLVDNHSFVIVNHAKITNTGIIENKLSFDIHDPNGDTVIKNYELIFELGYLEIIGIHLTVETPSAEKHYDGTPLTNKEWVQTAGELLPNHELTIVVTGTITDIGKAFNTFEYAILDENQNDISMNYIISKQQGILTILDPLIPISILSGSDAKEYDGTPLRKDEWKLVEGDLLSGHQLHVDVTGEITEIGVTHNVYDYRITDSQDNDVTALYSVDSFYGLLRIVGEDENGDNKEKDNLISNEGNLNLNFFGPPVFQVYSEIDDVVYLRDLSYGDYTKSGWTQPNVYHSPYGISPFSFPQLAINEPVPTHTIQVKPILRALPYFLPYYPVGGLYDNINDVYATHSYGIQYSVNYQSMSDVDYNAYRLTGTPYESIELEYRNFVYDNYLTLPTDTEEGLLDIAQRNGLHADSPTLIEDVEEFILNSGVYNLAYQPIPDNVDFALYFLEHSREGICQHFAMSATVMYRALGIPARYVTGFTTATSADEWVDVSPMQAHAWVEVYIDGFGWIPVEVTPGWVNEFAGQSPDSSEDLPELTIQSGNASKVYDGTPLTKNTYTVQGDLQDGHTLHVDVQGTITHIGETLNIFKYSVLDSEENDVTNAYIIKKQYGSLVVVPDNDKPTLEVQASEITRIYNGQTIQHTPEDFWIPSKNLPEGYSVILEIDGELKNVGRITTSINRTTFKVLDENDYDVTSQFNVVFYDGSIEVQKRKLEIHSFSAEKYYDGTPLIAEHFYIAKGTVVDGEILDVQVVGEQTNIGESYNYITSITIVNDTLECVLKNYQIEIYYGLLTVIGN